MEIENDVLPRNQRVIQQMANFSEDTEVIPESNSEEDEGSVSKISLLKCHYYYYKKTVLNFVGLNFLATSPFVIKYPRGFCLRAFICYVTNLIYICS